VPTDLLPEAPWARLSEVLSGVLGLHFPRERWTDLHRGLRAAAPDLGFGRVQDCVDWMLSATPTRAQVQVLAAHLTIGETYFFRDSGMFDALATHVLPPLIEARREAGQRRLRLWSAGCCTGEEPYSLAILLRQLLPDLADWHVTILATDINAGFLRKAVAGTYGDWSFRGTPPEFRTRWFRRTEGGRYALLPEVRATVSFAHLNLAQDNYPSLATDTNAMDVILCRNVLMYFTAEQTEKVIRNFHHALADDGWLALGPSETGVEQARQFSMWNFSGAMLHQKGAGKEAREILQPAPPVDWFLPEIAVETVATETVPPPPTEPAVAAMDLAVPSSPLEWAASAYAQGQYSAVVDRLLAPSAGPVGDPRVFSLLTRALANLGRLDEALGSCGHWLAADKLDTAGHYLRAMILLEQGDEPPARAALQRALYLAPDFVPAHFALGNLARLHGRGTEARRHFDNALQLLGRCHPEEVLPESDGLTAGRLAETIRALSPAEATP
jgi:chemotaxis protein methyltransferase CheR